MGNQPELIEYHNTIVRVLVQVQVRYLKGGRIAKERPTIRIGGWLGMGGTKSDVIFIRACSRVLLTFAFTDSSLGSAKLKQTEAAIGHHRDQIDARKAENYGFASTAAVPYAHIVARMLRKIHPKGTDIVLAPNPKDIVRYALLFFHAMGADRVCLRYGKT